MRSIQAKSNDFFRMHYDHIIMGLIILIVIFISLLVFLMYQISHRPLPAFNAVDPDNKTLTLTPFKDPNLLPETIIRWSSKAAITAYSFDYVNYKEQISKARSYFTSGGWTDYLNSINPVIQTVVQGQLFVNGIVSGTPVISNQGSSSGNKQLWRVQIPFLVTYQSANSTAKRHFMVTLTIIRIRTTENPQGIGIDQFVMVPS